MLSVCVGSGAEDSTHPGPSPSDSAFSDVTWWLKLARLGVFTP